MEKPWDRFESWRFSNWACFKAHRRRPPLLIHSYAKLDQGDSCAWGPEKLRLKRALIRTKLPTEDRKMRPTHPARIPHRKSQLLHPHNSVSVQIPEAGSMYQPVGASVHEKDRRKSWALTWNPRIFAVPVPRPEHRCDAARDSISLRFSSAPYTARLTYHFAVIR